MSSKLDSPESKETPLLLFDETSTVDDEQTITTSVFDVWRPAKSSYLYLFSATIIVSWLTTMVLSVRWGFIPLDDATSISSWCFYLLALLQRSTFWLYIPILFQNAITFIASNSIAHSPINTPTEHSGSNDQDIPMSDADHLWSSRLSEFLRAHVWPRSVRAYLTQIFVIITVFEITPLGFALHTRLANDYTRSNVISAVSWLIIILIMNPLTLFFAAYNPFAQPKKAGIIRETTVNTDNKLASSNGRSDIGVATATSPISKRVNDIKKYLSATTIPQTHSLSRVGLGLWIILTLTFSAYVGSSMIDRGLAFTQTCFILSLCTQFILPPIAAIYLTVTQQRDNNTTDFIDFAYTALLISAFCSLSGLFSSSVRWFLIIIRQTNINPDSLTSIFTLFYYICLSIFMYSSRIIGRYALPRSASLALLAFIQFFEETLANLLFLSFNPFDGFFFLVTVILIVKTVLRDADLMAESWYWICQRWRPNQQQSRTRSQRLQPVHNGVSANNDHDDNHDENSDAAEESRLVISWRRNFDQFILRHQNFICAMCSKVVVITTLVFDYTFTDRDGYSPNVTPAICSSTSALSFSANFPQCLPLCSDLPAPVDTSSAGYATGCYDTTAPALQIQFDGERRGLLLSAMVFTMIVQIITHFCLLFWFQRLDNNHPQACASVRERSEYNIIVKTRLGPHWSAHWAFILLAFVTSTRNMFLEARAVAYLALPDNRWVK